MKESLSLDGVLDAKKAGARAVFVDWFVARAGSVGLNARSSKGAILGMMMSFSVGGCAMAHIRPFHFELSGFWRNVRAHLELGIEQGSHRNNLGGTRSLRADMAVASKALGLIVNRVTRPLKIRAIG